MFLVYSNTGQIYEAREKPNREGNSKVTQEITLEELKSFTATMVKNTGAKGPET